MSMLTGVKKFNSKKTLSSQSGMGLVGVLVAAALVVIAALTVANFVSDQYQRSAKLEISGSCQNIANSLVEYIKKDETSLFISSYGPQAGDSIYTSNMDKTIDGIDRFAFFATPIHQFEGPTSSMNLSPGYTTLPPDWKYYNQLNIKNSTNRLIALAGSKNFCCDSLDLNSCGTQFYDDANPVPGFKISEKNVEVKLGIDFANITCVGGKLAPADLPDSRAATRADFKVRVTMNRGTPQEKTCEGTGTVQRTLDTSSSLTMIQYTKAELCPAGVITPAICGTVPPVHFTVRTFRSTGACETACMGVVSSKTTCDQTTSDPAPDLFDTFGNSACTANCAESEPGTAYLCRIGEKSWMDAHPNDWEPCETAIVHDADGSGAGTVSITYNPLTAGNDVTQKSTQAIITLNGLQNMRGYVADVRAVDTAGNVGPSFCENSSESCANGKPPHFVIINDSPLMGPIADGTDPKKFVGDTHDTIVDGRVDSLQAIDSSKYNSDLIFAPFSTNWYQCNAGAPKFSGTVSYSVPPVGNSITHTCDATLTLPDSSTVNLTNGAGCDCNGMTCTATLPNLTVNGTNTLQFHVYNACKELPPIPPQRWCLDTATGFNTGQNTASNEFGPNPNFKNIVTGTTGKSCGMSYLCPNIDGTYTASDQPCATPSDWSANSRSGCVPDPANNYCSVAVDPCGRYEITNNPSTIQYSTKMLGVAWGSPAATNKCLRFGGVQVGGNYCDTGSWCSNTGKCYNTCAKAGQVCTDDTQCDDPNYGVTSAQSGGPTCTNGRCTCPTNIYSPAAADCSQIYCPTLNSCPDPIGTPPTPPTACVGCSAWNVGAWSLCVGNHKSRSVTCPTSCCIGPKPDTDSSCPDCATPWNTEVLNGNSVTAYQSASATCGTCVSQTRTCNNGTLSGSYTNKTCTQNACNGACGPANGSTVSSAPTSGLCSAGTASGVSGSGPWTWTCSGLHGGSNAGCSANKAGSCGWKSLGFNGGQDPAGQCTGCPGGPTTSCHVDQPSAAGCDSSSEDGNTLHEYQCEPSTTWSYVDWVCDCPSTCANASTSPVTLVSMTACSYAGSSQPKNSFSGTECSPEVPFSSGPQYHSANYMNFTQSLTIKLSWKGGTYYCNYSAFMGSSSSTGNGSMSPSAIPGYSCANVTWYPTSIGWGGAPGGLNGGLNILGPGPGYTTCP